MSYNAFNIQNCSLAHCAGLPSQFPNDTKPQIALSGRSNVGKSSLVNTLLGRKSLARVSGEPGKTITVNFYSVDDKFYLVDLPGYGFAKRSAEERERLAQLGDGYFQTGRAALVVALIDMKVGATSDDITMLDYLNTLRISYVVAATKADKLNKTQRQQAYEKIPVPHEKIIPFSSWNGEGKSELWKVIFNALNNIQ